MTLAKSLLLFLLILVGFATVGLFFSGGPETVMAFGAVGLGAALTTLADLIIVERVRARRIPRLLAALLVLCSSALGIFAPFPIISGLAHLTRYTGPDDRGKVHLFQGEHSQAIFLTIYG